MLADMKRRHMAHHFHDESGNFGITTFFWDKVFGTYYDRPERPVKSATVFNLGYTEEVAEEFPRGGGAEWGRRHGASAAAGKRTEVISRLGYC